MGGRERVRAIVDATLFQKVITAVILVNAVVLGCETSPALVAEYGQVLHAIDRAVLAIFVVELAARMYAYGTAFFRDPWNWFDTVIVVIALLPTSGAFSVLRALRILRALRLISVVPSMRRVVSALLRALPGMASIGALIVLVLYVSAVMATKLFSVASPEYFGDLGDSLFTLFQVMTGEAWSEVARSVMREQPLAWIFFVTYIVITTFTVLNLFIAVAVSAMDAQVSEETGQRAPDQAEVNVVVLAELRELRAEVRALRAAEPQPRWAERPR
ncbi:MULTISPECIES: ion transporter [unclassified Crossiella]|uniref:ion transporter n=1 Tax=unclassified Crossiella TaxID=2620835 RepID=UPI001FFECC18|nr:MULTISPECIES: ion transporter [unclassified Crossiella]MCK2240652.1 ion transporter [Crossiella sp. S99.2]MCK2252897.1 ion transporter [Crossiella sp. S99.1]